MDGLRSVVVVVVATSSESQHLDRVMARIHDTTNSVTLTVGLVLMYDPRS